MKKYNCIVVFNANKSKVLFCERTKEPYKGLYNFVGGKVESGEDSMCAAYRELYEETGISRSDIQLHRLMDITYYHQEFILELYVGKLSEQKEVVEEVNPLVWLSLAENFANPKRFAGEQNIAHIINVALKYPLVDKSNYDGSRPKINILGIGVDGCKGGWIVATIGNDSLKIEKFISIEAIVNQYEKFDEFLIDMPIGLPSNNDHIRPDTIARKIVCGRTSTIFAVPSRQAVYVDSEKEQVKCNQDSLGKGLAKQTMAIIPKIRELDLFLSKNPKYKNVIKESHPEVCFARLNGEVVMTKKASIVGMNERIKILSKYLPELTEKFVLTKTKELKCNADDIVDAICLAVTANLNIQCKGEVIPCEPMKDENGLIMQMVIPQVTEYRC